MADPLTDFIIDDNRKAAWLEKLPVCDVCGEPIQESEYYEFDGEKVCEYCLEDYIRKNHRRHNEVLW